MKTQELCFLYRGRDEEEEGVTFFFFAVSVLFDINGGPTPYEGSQNYWCSVKWLPWSFCCTLSNFTIFKLHFHGSVNFKEQQLTQEQAKPLQQKHLRPEKEVPSQTDFCMLRVCLHNLVQITCTQELWFYHNTLHHHASNGFHIVLNLVTRDYRWLQMW